MPQTVTDNARLHGAEYQANLALRLGRRHDHDGFARATNRMYDTLEACQYPNFTTSRLIKRIGRNKALVLGLSKPLINLALKMEWPG